MPRVIGVVLVVVGGVWVLQGIGIAQGSVMTGRPIWAVIGAVLIVAGAVVLRRALNRAKALIQSEIDAVVPPPAPDPTD
jgi:drug/metabolite transporter (DMT)-like permease